MGMVLKVKNSLTGEPSYFSTLKISADPRDHQSLHPHFHCQIPPTTKLLKPKYHSHSYLTPVWIRFFGFWGKFLVQMNASIICNTVAVLVFMKVIHIRRNSKDGRNPTCLGNCKTMIPNFFKLLILRTGKERNKKTKSFTTGNKITALKRSLQVNGGSSMTCKFRSEDCTSRFRSLIQIKILAGTKAAWDFLQTVLNIKKGQVKFQLSMSLSSSSFFFFFFSVRLQILVVYLNVRGPCD